MTLEEIEFHIDIAFADDFGILTCEVARMDEQRMTGETGDKNAVIDLKTAAVL